MGVRRAVELVLEAVRHADDITVYGPLVHNPQVIELLNLRGVRCERDKDNISSGTVILRSHGVPFEVEGEFRARGLNILDATCPKVKRVQRLAQKHAEDGKRVLIFGDLDHAEVKAILSYAKGRAEVVQSQQDIERLDSDKTPALLAQTTQDRRKYEELAELLKKRYPDAVIEDTICDSTRERQQEIVKLARSADVVIVIGGRESGNTKRLVEIASSINPRTHWIELEQEADEIDLSNAGKIAITAGASTPAWVIKRVVERIAERTDSRPSWMSKLASAVRFAVVSSAMPVASGFFAALAAQRILGPRSAAAAAAVGLYLFSMHVLNNFAERKNAPFKDEPAKLELYRRHGKLLAAFAVAAAIAALVLVAGFGVVPVIGVLVAELFGVLYTLPVLPRWATRVFGIRRLKDIAASKSLFIATAWCWVTILPVWWKAKLNFRTGFVASALLFLLVASRAILFDLFDIHADRLVGAETLPTKIGDKRTYLLLLAMLSAMGLFAVALGVSGTIDVGQAIVWTTVAIVAIALIPIFKSETLERSRTLKAAITDLGLIALGTLSLFVG